MAFVPPPLPARPPAPPAQVQVDSVTVNAATILGVIRDLAGVLGAGGKVGWDDCLAAAKVKHGLGHEATELAIEALLKQGEIYEPLLGTLRLPYE